MRHSMPSFSLALAALSLLACSSGSPPSPQGPADGPPPDQASVSFASGKLIELWFHDVLAGRPVGNVTAGTRRFQRSQLPAQYTVLAAMPESGTWSPTFDGTYSVVFEVNGQRLSVANIEPYYLTSAWPGYAAPWASGPGRFEIRAVAHEGKGGTGAVMGTRIETFEIVD
jgi:hypothetical protein